jgi:hypothetical protein
MSSKGVKSSKRRTTNEAPTQLHQLNDATTRIEQTTYDKVMNFKSATTFADEDRKKTAPLVMQVAITATSIATPTKSGGKRKAKNLSCSRCDQAYSCLLVQRKRIKQQ